MPDDDKVVLGRTWLDENPGDQRRKAQEAREKVERALEEFFQTLPEHQRAPGAVLRTEWEQGTLRSSMTLLDIREHDKKLVSLTRWLTVLTVAVIVLTAVLIVVTVWR